MCPGWKRLRPIKQFQKGCRSLVERYSCQIVRAEQSLNIRDGLFEQGRRPAQNIRLRKLRIDESDIKDRVNIFWPDFMKSITRGDKNDLRKSESRIEYLFWLENERNINTYSQGQTTCKVEYRLRTRRISGWLLLRMCWILEW